MRTRNGFRILRLHRLDARTGSTLEEGCRFVECLAAGPLGDVDVTHVTIPPASRTSPHLHRRAVCLVYVVDGTGIAHLGGRRRRVALNDFVVIAPETVHSFEARTEPLTLLAVHSPAVSRGSGSVDVEYRKE